MPTGWEISPGGLVGALAPVLAARGGAWVGWPGTTGLTLPFSHAHMALHPVALTPLEHERYYEGFSNRTLWPLYHDAIRAPELDLDWWNAYVSVNERFAAAAAEVAAPGAAVWVHDYQLQLVPALLRRLRSDVKIGFFLHIPFPSPELFAGLPWRRQVIVGLLGADLVGFQVPNDAANFVRSARALARVDVCSRRLRFDGRAVDIGAFPISIDVEKVERAASSDQTVRRAAAIRDELGAPRHVLLGVDRLDYTKGIVARLEAFRDLLRAGVLSVSDHVMVQVAVPSREGLVQYCAERERIERLVDEINGENAPMGRPAVHYLHRSLPFDELIALYRAADVMLVTPLRDGMNLVAKEYVASRIDGSGVLVLSTFAGSARELHAARLVDPHDGDDLRTAIVDAVSMPVDEARRRMARLRSTVRSSTVHQWADRFLSALDHASLPVLSGA